MFMMPEHARTPSTAEGEPEYDFSAARLLDVIRARLWLLLLTVVLLVLAALAYSLVQEPKYEASIRIIVGQERAITETPNDVLGLQQLTRTMAEAVDSRPVAEAVIRRLDLQITLEQFFENLGVEQVPETQFIEVDYEDPDPETAQKVADAVGEEFSQQITEVSPSASAITATIWERAVVPDEPVTPNTLFNMLVALALGLVLGLGLVVLLELLDDSWKSPEEAERISGFPTFGTIPEFSAPKNKKRS